MDLAVEATCHAIEERHWWFQGRRHCILRLIDKLRLSHDAPILEVGCSSGLLIDELRRRGYANLRGIDISPVAIANCVGRGLTADVMDAGAPALAEGAYDLIIASDVLEHLADDDAALGRWRALLKPGGILIVFVPAFMFFWSAHDEGAHHFRRYTRRGLMRKIRAAGLDVSFSSYWNFALFWPALVAKGGLSMPSRAVNAMLTALLRVENAALGAGLPLPVGISTMALARRPA